MAAAAAVVSNCVPELQTDFFETFHLRVEKVLYIGASSEVVLASSIQDLSHKRAVKKISLKEEDLQDRELSAKEAKALFHKEIEILRTLDHPNIIGGVNGVICPDYMALSMDFCPNGTLVTHLKKMTNGLIDRYFDGMVSGVCYIHSLRIVHGNIKLQNIFVNAKNKAVLTDFGFSYKMPENVSYVKTAGATMAYLSPEVLMKRNKVDPFKCDSYAVGVVLRCLVLKRRPGYCPDYLQEVKESPHVCAMFRYFLEALLHRKPSRRATMAQVQTTLDEFVPEDYTEELSLNCRPEEESPSTASPPRKKIRSQESAKHPTMSLRGGNAYKLRSFLKKKKCYCTRC
ncbi:serine/threonine protein kinase [Plakobranchus ocellatus]|uniref:Serine/threonine protein kinase n=1 Tax=Plakobranchus ocellatus TaxID=259542 RepID=A0AAV4CAA3_9GAST|nr:serine/threonine protein kinase [Plakobranchus ocellatus]